MRTISAADEALFTAPGGRGSWLRVDVKDSGGTFRDLTTYPGQNMVLEATWGESVDSPGMSGTIKLKREIELLSLAPLMNTSPLNLGFDPAGTPAALLAVKREVKIYTADVPTDKTPGAGDWRLSFHGRIDIVNWGGQEEVELKVSDLQGDLRDTFIEYERVYAHANPADGDATKGLLVFEALGVYAVGNLVFPTEANRNGHFYKVSAITTGITAATEPAWPTGGGATVVSAGVTFAEAGTTTTTTGTAVETVMQQLLTDNGTGVTLVTPSSPGWLIRWYLQQRVSLWEALRVLVEQIGADLRYVYDSGSTSFKLTFSSPDRAKTTPDRTFSAAQKFEVTRLEVRVDDIRNAIRVAYSNSQSLDAAGQPIRGFVDRTDSASIAAYGRRFMEIIESSSSNIDSSTEANTMADAALADLSTPTAEKEVGLPFFPFVELGDLYRFSGDAVHHSGNLDLAVVGYQHSINLAGGFTTLTCRGKPSGGSERWLAKAGDIHPDKLHRFTAGNTSGLTIDATSVVGGMLLKVAGTYDKRALGNAFEFHVSKTPGFTPSSATKVKTGDGDQVVASDLIPGREHYFKVIPTGRNEGKIVRGLPSVEQSFIAGQGSAGHLKEGVAWGAAPLNGGFETRVDPTGMPDHWTEALGSLGAELTVQEDGDGLSGDRYLRLQNGGGASTALFPITNEAMEANRYPGRYLVSWWMKNGVSNSSPSNYSLTITFYDYAGNSVGSTSLAAIIDGEYAPGHWVRQQVISVLPTGITDARSARLTVRWREGATMQVDIDDVRIQYLGSPWYSFDDTSNFIDSYDQIPAFENSWANYGSGYQTAQFRHDQFGTWWLRGTIASGTIGNRFAVLPGIARPPAIISHVNESWGAFGRLEINSNGDLVPRVGDTGGGGGSCRSFCLDGAHWTTFS